jgi:hypothetical protein
MVYPMNEKCLSVLTAQEYALESSALFNPSIVEDFDQSDLEIGEKRIIISFRATGKVISSIILEEQSWIRITISM